MFALIKELCELVGPVGQEHEVLDRVEGLWRAEGLTVERTKIGNLYAHVGAHGGSSGPRVVMAAHADELTYLVRAIHPDGFLWLAGGQAWVRTAGLRNSFTIGQRVKVVARKGVIPGVIASVTG